MSSSDLNSSFWQIPLHKNSRKYTAFLHQEKSYEFNAAPFGLKTSTAALVRALDRVLLGLQDYVINYVDDLLIASETEEDHIEHLRSSKNSRHQGLQNTKKFQATKELFGPSKFQRKVHKPLCR